MSGDAAPLVPPGFLFGVGTFGYQIEGGYNGTGEPANNWLWWERSGRIEPSGIGCDFWNRPEEALDRAASIGCDAFRLSVEWARIEPADGQVDQQALDRYAAILAMCADRSMVPMVTLHHLTHPWWLGHEYWLTPGSPDRFNAHVGRVLPALAPHCRRWVTIHDPTLVALSGWVTGACPPGRRGAVADAWAVLDNLLTAHLLAYRTIHRLQTGAQVTLTTSPSTVYELDHLLTDLLSARTLAIGVGELDQWIEERRTLHDQAVRPADPTERALRKLFAATSPYGRKATPVPSALSVRPGRARAGRLRPRAPRRVVDVLFSPDPSPESFSDPPSDPSSGPDGDPSSGPGRGPRPGQAIDATGINWYDPAGRNRFGLPRHQTGGRWSPRPLRLPWEVAVDPEGFGHPSPTDLEQPPGPPASIIENGIATRVRNGRPLPRSDGWDRPSYLRAHMSSLLRALETGARIEAYLHRSLVDGYEWGSYEPRFGLFGMDRSRGARGIRWMATDATGRDAPGTYRTLIAAARDGDPGLFSSRPGDLRSSRPGRHR